MLLLPIYIPFTSSVIITSGKHPPSIPVGTLHCIAPEMMAALFCHRFSKNVNPESSVGFVDYDCAVDWWGLGTLVFEMIFGCIPDWNRSQRTISPIAIEQLTKEFSAVTGITTPTLNDFSENDDSHEYRWAADPTQQLMAWFAVSSARTMCDGIGASIDSHVVIHPSSFSANNPVAEIKQSIVATWDCETLLAPLLRDPSLTSGRACNADHLTAEMMMQRKLVEMEQHELWEAKSFIEDLLCIDPALRLSGSYPDKVRSHLFFNSAVPGSRQVDWAAIATGSAVPGDVDFDRRLGFVEALESVLSGPVSDDEIDDMINFHTDAPCSSPNKRVLAESKIGSCDDSLTDEQQQLFSAF